MYLLLVSIALLWIMVLLVSELCLNLYFSKGDPKKLYLQIFSGQRMKQLYSLHFISFSSWISFHYDTPYIAWWFVPLIILGFWLYSLLTWWKGIRKPIDHKVGYVFIIGPLILYTISVTILFFSQL